MKCAVCELNILGVSLPVNKRLHMWILVYIRNTSVTWYDSVCASVPAYNYSEYFQLRSSLSEPAYYHIKVNMLYLHSLKHVGEHWKTIKRVFFGCYNVYIQPPVKHVENKTWCSVFLSCLSYSEPSNDLNVVWLLTSHSLKMNLLAINMNL